MTRATIAVGSPGVYRDRQGTRVEIIAMSVRGDKLGCWIGIDDEDQLFFWNVDGTFESNPALTDYDIVGVWSK